MSYLHTVSNSQYPAVKGRVKIRNKEKVKVVKQKLEKIKPREIRMPDSKMWEEDDFDLDLQGSEVVREPGQEREELRLPDLEEIVVPEEMFVPEENLVEWEVEIAGEEPEVERLEVEQRER